MSKEESSLGITILLVFVTISFIFTLASIAWLFIPDTFLESKSHETVYVEKTIDVEVVHKFTDKENDTSDFEYYITVKGATPKGEGFCNKYPVLKEEYDKVKVGHNIPAKYIMRKSNCYTWSNISLLPLT